MGLIYTAVVDTGIYKASECEGAKYAVLKAGNSVERTGISDTGRAIKIRYKGNDAWVALSKLRLKSATAPEPVAPVTIPVVAKVADFVQRALVRVKPGFTPGWALTQAGRLKRYGSSEAAVRKHLVTCVWKGKKFAIHALEVDRFNAWTREVDLYELAHRKNYRFTETYSFCWRKVRGGTLLSNHSFGIAIDINPGKNPMGSRLVTDIPPYFVSIGKKYGIRWGGNYKGRKDAMHFEL